MPFANRALLALKRIAIVIGIAMAFSLGLMSAIYLSLRSSETRVPDVIGKDRASAENTISDAGLNFRVRATRASSEARPDTVLIQLPRAGEIVKVGQTVAVDISRSTKEGESSTAAAPTSNTNSSEDKESEASENRNSQASTNDNKPKRKPANANANNTNTNRSADRNRNSNANRPTTRENVNRNARPSINQNQSGENNNRGAGNANRRPIITPTP